MHTLEHDTTWSVQVLGSDEDPRCSAEHHATRRTLSIITQSRGTGDLTNTITSHWQVRIERSMGGGRTFGLRGVEVHGTDLGAVKSSR